jgi:hypothetical protein
MTPLLGQGITRRLLDHLEAISDDPLSMTENGRIPDDAHSIVNQALDGIDRTRAAHLAAALAARYAARLGLDAPEGYGDHRLRDAGAVDLVTAHLLTHMEIDPLVCAWIANDVRTAEIIDDETFEVVANVCSLHAPGRGTNETTVRIADGVTWYGTGHVGIESLPHTIAATCGGRMLSKVLSHPALDPLHLRITAVEEHADTTTLSVDADMRALSPSDLVAMGPAGCR